MTAQLDETPVRDLYQRLISAWNDRDAAGFAELFATTGTSIGFDGSTMVGSADIRAHLAAIFADHPTAVYVTKVREVRPVGTDALLLWAIVGMVPPGGSALNPGGIAHQTVLAEKEAGVWRIVLLQNTPAQYHGRPELVEQHTAELQQLV